jgi:hypothetical protein
MYELLPTEWTDARAFVELCAQRFGRDARDVRRRLANLHRLRCVERRTNPDVLNQPQIRRRE